MTTVLEIGAELVRARRAQGISQRELGERLGVRQQQIARWEATCYRGASLERVDEAARVLGVGLPQAAAATLPLAAEAPAVYSAGGDAGPRVDPVRDLGEIATRIREHGDRFRDEFGIERIGVFGSFAYGEQTSASDVDLLIDFRQKPMGFAYFGIGVLAEGILGRPVDFVEAQFLRERLRDRVLKETVYVWAA